VFNLIDKMMAQRARLKYQGAKESVDTGLLSSAIQSDDRINCEKILLAITSQDKHESLKKYLASKKTPEDIYTIGEHLLLSAAQSQATKIVDFLLEQNINPIRTNINGGSCLLETIPGNPKMAAKYLEKYGFVTNYAVNESPEDQSYEFWASIKQEVSDPESPLAQAIGRTSPVDNALIDFAS
jgi:hypothetical protein